MPTTVLVSRRAAASLAGGSHRWLIGLTDGAADTWYVLGSVPLMTGTPSSAALTDLNLAGLSALGVFVPSGLSPTDSRLADITTLSPDTRSLMVSALSCAPSLSPSQSASKSPKRCTRPQFPYLAWEVVTRDSDHGSRVPVSEVTVVDGFVLERLRILRFRGVRPLCIEEGGRRPYLVASRVVMVGEDEGDETEQKKGGGGVFLVSPLERASVPAVPPPAVVSSRIAESFPAPAERASVDVLGFSIVGRTSELDAMRDLDATISRDASAAVARSHAVEMMEARRRLAIPDLCSLSGSPDVLLNVHESLGLGSGPSAVAGGERALVRGCYEYRHYLQDGARDSGWGCAYRSLQTVVSWFERGGLRCKCCCERPGEIPSHEDIQRMLVDAGDKEPSFVGSHGWIGAVEVSFCLKKLCGIDSRVLHLNSGTEFPSRARELATHFAVNGTPVMIGGGVLAYTLLGVDWNRDTGEALFLILDPHYEGSDNIASVGNGKWCAWHKADLFRRDCFYNLCLPCLPPWFH